MLIITGLRLAQETKKKETLLFLNDFINSQLGVRVVIDDFFTLSMSFPKPVVIIMQTVQDKRIVLENKSQLKHYQSQDNKAIYINEYYPPVAQKRKRRRDTDIINYMKDQGQGDAVSYIRGTLAVNGELYKKKVRPPTPKELVTLKPQKLNNILQIETIKGQEFVKSGSKFMAFVAPVHTHDDVKELYMKIKLIKPDARHVVCAYWI